MIEKIWTANKKETLNEFLRQKIPELLEGEISNSKIRRLIVSGAVYINSKQCRIPSFKINSGSTIKVLIDKEKFFFEKQPEDADFELTENDVLFEDEYLIAINKPPFLPTEQTITGQRKNAHDCTVEYLWKKNPSLRNPPYVGIMHRLDRETSGILLFTKSRSVNKDISEMFKNRGIKKIYRAVCTGKIPEQKEFTVENFIARISPKSSACKMGIVPESKGGLFAKTDFKIISEKNGFIQIDCQLHTGRTHQIRVQLSSLNLPIAGDELYGGIKSDRIKLHARKMEFVYPVSKEKITIESEIPKDFFS
ncbi:MAG: RluA family pseudouridine synthase [Treponema sp.]|uniref:RluA family pseudouridine synthase n=1 Tax=Treponema sp. TaxID=166 RepID=UPI00280AF09A|nr:RluA family pseudouridine synthase [uncultured Treponema sp.]MEE0351899.1 RluA family pseudouridine synthase [Treponema sp.]